jgi:hypothetical protein
MWSERQLWVAVGLTVVAIWTALAMAVFGWLHDEQGVTWCSRILLGIGLTMLAMLLHHTSRQKQL